MKKNTFSNIRNANCVVKGFLSDFSAEKKVMSMKMKKIWARFWLNLEVKREWVCIILYGKEWRISTKDEFLLQSDITRIRLQIWY